MKDDRLRPSRSGGVGGGCKGSCFSTVVSEWIAGGVRIRHKSPTHTLLNRSDIIHVRIKGERYYGI